MLSNEVYRILLDRLLTGKLLPGDLINRRQIAQELEVSVAPVLEAMVRLEYDGFLESLPRKGTRVRPIRREEVAGQLYLREGIECTAARLYYGKKLTDNMPSLNLAAKKADDSELPDFEHWKAELAYHRQLVELAGYAALTQAFDKVAAPYLFYQIHYLHAASPRTQLSSHQSLLEKLSGNSPDKAEQAMRAHIRNGREYYIREAD